MAVPTDRNGLREDEDDDEELSGEIEWDEPDIPPHLQAVVDASLHGDLDALRNALDNQTFNIDEPLEDGDAAIHLCCLYGHLPCVKLLVEHGADIEVRDEDGAIPLHDACAGGFTEIVQFLINAGDAVCVRRMLDTIDVEGDTPLHHAARGEHMGAVQVLLASGASRTTRNIYGKTPAELADLESDVRIVLEGGAVQ